MGWIQFCPSTLRIIDRSKKIIRNRLSATAVHRGPERTQCTTLDGLKVALRLGFSQRAEDNALQRITTYYFEYYTITQLLGHYYMIKICCSFLWDLTSEAARNGID